MDKLGSFFDADYADLSTDTRADDDIPKFYMARDATIAIAPEYRARDYGASITALVTRIGRVQGSGKPDDDAKVTITATLLSVNEQQRNVVIDEANQSAMVLQPEATVWYGLPQKPANPSGSGNATGAAGSTAAGQSSSSEDKAGPPSMSDIPETVLRVYKVLYYLDRERVRVTQNLLADGQKAMNPETGKLHPKLDVVPQLLQGATMSPKVKEQYYPHCRLGYVPLHKLNKPPPKQPKSEKASKYAKKESREIKPEMPSDEDLKLEVTAYATDIKTVNTVMMLIALYKQAIKPTEAKAYRPGEPLDITVSVAAGVTDATVITMTGVTSSVLIKAAYVELGPSPNYDPIEPDLTPRIEAKKCQDTDKQLYARSFLAIAHHTGYFTTWMEPVAVMAKNRPGFDLEEATKRYKSQNNTESFFTHNILLSNEEYLREQVEMGKRESDCVIAAIPATADAFWSSKQQTTKESPQQLDLAIHGFQWKRRPIVCENPDADPDERIYRCYASRLGKINGVLDSGCDDLKAWGIYSKDEKNWTALMPRALEHFRGGCSAFIRYFASDREFEIDQRSYAKKRSTLEPAVLDFIQEHTRVEADGEEYLRVEHDKLAYTRDLIMNLAAPAATYQLRVKRWIFDYATLIRTIGLRVPTPHAAFLLERNKPENMLTPLPAKVYSDNNNVIYISVAGEKKEKRLANLEEWAKKGYDFYVVNPVEKLPILKSLKRYSAKETDVLFSKEFREGKTSRADILKRNGIPNSRIEASLETARYIDGYIVAVNPRSTQLADEAWKGLEETLKNITAKKTAEAPKEVAGPEASLAAAATATATATAPTQSPQVPQKPSTPPPNEDGMDVDKTDKEEGKKEASEPKEESGGKASKKKKQPLPPPPADQDEGNGESQEPASTPSTSSRGKKAASKRKVAAAEDDGEGYSNSFVDEAARNPDSLNEDSDDEPSSEEASARSKKAKKTAASNGSKRSKRN